MQSEQTEDFLYKTMKSYFLITANVFLPKSSNYRLHYFCLFTVLRETKNPIKNRLIGFLAEMDINNPELSKAGNLFTLKSGPSCVGLNSHGK